jgi:hypothetical protein
MQVEVTSVGRDENFYTINGNPARHAVLNMQANGKSVSGDCYIIAHGNDFFIEMYYEIPGSSPSDASTATGIMQTFTIIG